MPKTPPAAPPAQDLNPAGAELDYFPASQITIGANYRLPDGPDAYTAFELDRILEIDQAWLDDLTEVGSNFEPVALLRRPPGADGQPLDPPYVVKHGGARRVRGCAVAGLPVYAYIAGDETDANANELARVINQYRENHQRKRTSAAADAGAIQGMLDFGMSEAAVCRTLRLDGGKDAIAAARKVTKSRVAGMIAETYPLDLLQTAAIAEFDAAGDDEAVTQLAATVDTDPAQFEHDAAKLRDSAADRAQRRQVIADLNAAGVTIIDRDNEIWQRRVVHLRDQDGKQITDEQHASCPGHAAYVDSSQQPVDGKWRHVWTASFICTDPDANGHASFTSRQHGTEGQTPAERQAELDEKRRVRAGNAEWRVAAKVRQQHVRDKIVPLTKLPAAWDVQGYRFAVLATDTYALQYSLNRHHPLACTWLGLTADPKLNGDAAKLSALGAAAAKSKQPVIELVLFLAAAERRAGESEAWQWEDLGYRNERAALTLYLRFLETTGYALSPIEAHIAKTGRRGKYKPQDTRGGHPQVTVREIADEAASGSDSAAGGKTGHGGVMTGPANFTPVDRGDGTPSGPVPDGIVMCAGFEDCVNGPHEHEQMGPDTALPCVLHPELVDAAYAGDDAESRTA